MVDVIKDYLVSLGFGINTQSLNQARQAMRDAEGFISRFAGASSTQFAVAGVAVTTFVATASIGIAKFMNDLAQAELRTQMFARQMYTTADNAGALTNSLQAMGRTMEELYLSPELMQQFKELRNQSFSMRPPDEFKEQMKFIRSITFEFQRLKLEATYAMQWIGYYVVKYLEGPMKQFKATMKTINDTIMKNMPKWTKTIAMVLSWIGRLAIALYSVKDAILLVAGAFTAFKAFNLLSSPIGMMIMGLTALLLLIDDYNTWKDGGESQFGDMWQSLTDSGVFEAVDKIKVSVENLWEALQKVLKSIGDIILKISGTGDFKDFADLLEKRIKNALEGIAKYLQSIADLLNGDLKKGWENFKSGTNDLFLGGDNKDAAGNESAHPYVDKFNSLMDKINPLTGLARSIGENIGSSISGYLYPQAQKTSLNTSQSNVFNIYGSDPQGTANAVERNIDGLMMRAQQGWG